MFAAYLFLAAFFAVLFGPVILFVLQLVGVRWAFRVGFPMAEVRASVGTASRINDPTGWVKVKERKGVQLITEQFWNTNPRRNFFTSGWPDRLMGVADETEDGALLVLRADTFSSFLWISFIVIAMICIWGLVTRQPGMSDAEGVIFAVCFGALFMGAALFFAKRTKRRAADLANHLGFTLPQSAV